MTQARSVYWPPEPQNRSRLVRVAFVFLGKRDVDGQVEPHVTIVNAVGSKLMWFDNEEYQQFTALSPRLMSYMDLYKDKARVERNRQLELRSRRIAERRARSQAAEESIIE